MGLKKICSAIISVFMIISLSGCVDNNAGDISWSDDVSIKENTLDSDIPVWSEDGNIGTRTVRTPSNVPSHLQLALFAHMSYWPFELNEPYDCTDKEFTDNIINYNGYVNSFDLEMKDWSFVTYKHYNVSGLQIALYSNEDALVLAIRGTNDWQTFVEFAWGYNNPFYEEHSQIGSLCRFFELPETVENLEGATDIYITGHSLGGFLALVAEDRLNEKYGNSIREVVTFNSVGVVRNEESASLAERLKSRATRYYVADDPVVGNASEDGIGKAVCISQTWFDGAYAGHSMMNFYEGLNADYRFTGAEFSGQIICDANNEWSSYWGNFEISNKDGTLLARLPFSGDIYEFDWSGYGLEYDYYNINITKPGYKTLEIQNYDLTMNVSEETFILNIDNEYKSSTIDTYNSMNFTSFTFTNENEVEITAMLGTLSYKGRYEVREGNFVFTASDGSGYTISMPIQLDGETMYLFHKTSNGKTPRNGTKFSGTYLAVNDNEFQKQSVESSKTSFQLSGKYTAVDSMVGMSGYDSFTFSDKNKVSASMINGMMVYDGTYEIVNGVSNLLGTSETLIFTWDGDTSASVNMPFEMSGESLYINGAEYKK